MCLLHRNILTFHLLLTANNELDLDLYVASKSTQCQGVWIGIRATHLYQHLDWAWNCTSKRTRSWTHYYVERCLPTFPDGQIWIEQIYAKAMDHEATKYMPYCGIGKLGSFHLSTCPIAELFCLENKLRKPRILVRIHFFEWYEKGLPAMETYGSSIR